VSKFKIDDEVVWFEIAQQIATRHDQLSLRNLSVCAFALTNISRLKPVILNFDDLFKTMELSFVKKFESGGVVG
jgi:hypothetical protein